MLTGVNQLSHKVIFLLFEGGTSPLVHSWIIHSTLVIPSAPRLILAQMPLIARLQIKSGVKVTAVKSHSHWFQWSRLFLVALSAGRAFVGLNHFLLRDYGMEGGMYSEHFLTNQSESCERHERKMDGYRRLWIKAICGQDQGMHHSRIRA